jgi:DNA-binding response OmpR family regulator
MAQILIIDDKAAVRALFEEELKSKGHQVTALGDTALVEPAIRLQKPDLVLLDLYMKENRGWGVLEAIKCKNPSLPVLIITAYDSYSGDPRMALAEGIVIKSFDFDHLLGRMDEILQRKDPPAVELLFSGRKSSCLGGVRSSAEKGASPQPQQ